ncbi:MAG: dienelactone hydrolase family protein [Dehalococcoidia bacterium]|jgi:phospholipase/carboxylesterase|nr:dienelactone hydrolase family protein [Dehalococcoidia bacterium]MEE2927547.1 dienelactone hydrolase family protein [Chloroflexota bacterium]|tara:strand:+ start:553 stop:1242 length:690 start_codon:yes stop_codon:yes gene_type:complete
MQAEQHQGAGLKYLTITPDGYDPELPYPLMIMLHGFGANMQDLAGLAPAISSTGYVYACPNAPISFDLGGGHIGYGWTSPRDMAKDGEVEEAEKLLDGFFSEVFERFKVGPDRTILMGFSQGGRMTYRCGVGRPQPFAGLAALSASLSEPQELEPRLSDDRSQPIFVAHGTSDPQVPAERAHNAIKWFEEFGFQPEYHEYNMGHSISDEVINDLIPWMGKILPPQEPGK